MPDIKEINKLKSFVTYRYVEDKLVVFYRGVALFNINKKTRIEAFAFVKEKQSDILKCVASAVAKKGLAC